MGQGYRRVAVNLSVAGGSVCPMEESLVFLSGAGLPGWIWDEVRDGLEESVVPVYPRDPAAALTEYADTVLAQVSATRFILVAHSAGGVVAQAVTASAPDRVVGVLGVSAVWPGAGRSFAAALPLPQRWLLPAILRLAGTRPPEKQIRSGLARGLPEAVVDRLVGEFSPEARRLFLDAAPEAVLPAHRGYVHTTADREIPVAVQRRSAAALGGDFERELATGHLPMVEDPAGLRQAIKEFVQVRHGA